MTKDEIDRMINEAILNGHTHDEILRLIEFLKMQQQYAPQPGLSPTYPPHSVWTTTSGLGLTPEQEKRLQTLKEERKTKQKEEVISAFTALPNYMRQHIVDSILWTRAITIFEKQDEISTEEEMLQSMKDNSFLSNTIRLKPSPPIRIETLHSKYSRIYINEEIVKIDELVQAHAQKCIEEGITGQLNTDSK